MSSLKLTKCEIKLLLFGNVKKFPFLYVGEEKTDIYDGGRENEEEGRLNVDCGCISYTSWNFILDLKTPRMFISFNLKLSFYS